MASSSSHHHHRILTILILALCAAFGAYGTLGAGFKNGLFESITEATGAHVPAREKYLPGGPVPYKTTYTGVSAVDDQLVTLIAFFTYIIDGPKTWDVTCVYWYFMAQFCAAWTLISLEGLRTGNRRRAVSWTGTLGIIFQNITYTVSVPIYLIIHLLTSPTSSANPAPSDLSVDIVDLAILPLCTVLSFQVPAAMMYLASPAIVSAPAHYAWQAIWQVFPLTHAIYRLVLGRLIQTSPSPGPAPNRNINLKNLGRFRARVVDVYRYVLLLCVLPHALLLAAALTPASVVPDVVRPLFEQVGLASAFVPHWPWNSPTAVQVVVVEAASAGPTRATATATATATVTVTAEGKADLVKLFLQWDLYCGSAAIIVWAVFVYCQVQVAHPDLEQGRVRLLWSALPKALLWGLLGGPVGAAAVLLRDRDIRATDQQLEDVSGGKKNE